MRLFPTLLQVERLATSIGMAATVTGGTAPKHLAGKSANPTQ